MVEDDVELSKHYGRYIDLCRAAINGKWNRAMIGCSLYKPIVNELSYESKNEWNPIRFNANSFVKDQSAPFLAFQLPSSWGSIYAGLPWAKLQAYYRLRRFHSENKVVVPNARSNDWGKSWKKYRSPLTMIARYLIELNYSCNWFLLYPVFGKFSLSTNYFEHGVHTGDNEAKDFSKETLKHSDYRFSVPLLTFDSIALHSPVNVSDLNALDIYHQHVYNSDRAFTSIKGGNISWKRLCNLQKEVYAS